MYLSMFNFEGAEGLAGSFLVLAFMVTLFLWKLTVFSIGNYFRPPVKIYFPNKVLQKEKLEDKIPEISMEVLHNSYSLQRSKRTSDSLKSLRQNSSESMRWLRRNSRQSSESMKSMKERSKSLNSLAMDLKANDTQGRRTQFQLPPIRKSTTIRSLTNVD